MASDLLEYGKLQEFLVSLVPPRPEEMRLMERHAEEQDFPIIGPAAVTRAAK